MQTVFGFKQRQSQVFLEDGTRVPVTVVSVADHIVTQLKDEEKDGYKALQLGIGSSKKTPKSLMGQLKKSKLTKAPAFIREVRLEADEDTSNLSLGSNIPLSEVLQPGDTVSVTGTSKGKGFAGGVKRYGFRGGPKTHGQSDRHRAPGSIGQGTTPGRVYKGKRMAGHMGHEQVTVQNLYIVDIQGSDVYVAGLIPGTRNALVRLEKVGEKKNFVPIFKIVDETAQEEENTQKAEEVQTQAEEGTQEPKEEKTEAKVQAAETEAVEEKEEEHGTK